MKKIINWSSAEGQKTIAFVVRERNKKKPKTYREISQLVNQQFELPRYVDGEDMKHLYRRKKKGFIEKFGKISSNKDLMYIYEEIDKKERMEQPPVQEVVLLLSDAQIDKIINTKESQEMEFFTRKMDQLTHSMIKSAKAQKKKSNTNTLNFLMVKDNIQHASSNQEQQLDTVTLDQIFVAAEKIAKGLVALLDSFESINVTSVVGNSESNKSATHINYEYLLYKVIEKMLENYSDRITWSYKTLLDL